MGGAPLNLGRTCRTGLQWLKFRWRFTCQRFRIGRDERAAVDPREYILRRVHKNDYKPQLADPVQRLGFTPNKNDRDGLSVHCELFIRAETLAWCGRKPGEYVIVRMLAADLVNEFGLTLRPSPDPNVPGHTVIPELSFIEDKKKFERVKELARALAKVARERIVYKPPNL